ncbi:uncharacterized protein LOC144464333 [Epinephelus lanceolatus]
MFYIVEFYETQEVEVVPAAWVADDVCQWPTYYKPDELAKAIKNEEQPGDSWEEYRVRILYKAASYKAARLKLPEAETHTDLQTAEEDDDMPRRKRKRKQNTQFESDSEDSPAAKRRGSLPAAPKIQGPSVQSTLERRALSPQPRPRHQLASPELTASPERRPPLASPGNTTPTEGQRSSATALLRRLLTNQEMIMDQLKIVTLTLQKIQVEHVGGQEVLEADLFPLKDISSLLAVERRVREEVDYKKKMTARINHVCSFFPEITALSVIGGVDIKDMVWMIMKHLFTNSLAKQLNWRGVNGKTAFHSLQLKDVITGTVRNNHLTATATDQEVEAYIKRWLHLTGDRDGGRREREEKRHASQHTCKSATIPILQYMCDTVLQQKSR